MGYPVFFNGLREFGLGYLEISNHLHPKTQRSDAHAIIQQKHFNDTLNILN
jgi:hypothetical protein